MIERNGTKYINEPHAGGGNPVLAIGGDGQKTEAIFTDMLGTSMGKVEENRYSAIDKTSFGADTSDSASFFTGKPYVEDLGYAFLFRNYRADMGKWLSQDLIGYPDGWNNFAYCNNITTMMFDFLGADGVYGNATFFNHDSFYAMGRDGVPFFNPDNPIMNAIEDYFPAAHYFAVVHDSWVDSLSEAGYPDAVINVPTMPVAYIYAFLEASYQNFLDFIEYAKRIIGKDPTPVPENVIME